MSKLNSKLITPNTEIKVGDKVYPETAVAAVFGTQGMSYQRVEKSEFSRYTNRELEAYNNAQDALPEAFRRIFANSLRSLPFALKTYAGVRRLADLQKAEEELSKNSELFEVYKNLLEDIYDADPLKEGSVKVQTRTAESVLAYSEDPEMLEKTVKRYKVNLPEYFTKSKTEALQTKKDAMLSSNTKSTITKEDILVGKFGSVAGSFSGREYVKPTKTKQLRAGTENAAGDKYVPYFRIFVNPSEFEFINKIGEYKNQWNQRTIKDADKTINGEITRDERNQIISDLRKSRYFNGWYKDLAAQFGLSEYADKISLSMNFAGRTVKVKNA